MPDLATRSISGCGSGFRCVPRGPDDGGVQRLVHIGLGACDVVLEFDVDGFPQRVDVAQGLVALGYRFQDDAKGYDVVDILEAQILGEIIFW
jgi:hypothetical protein